MSIRVDSSPLIAGAVVVGDPGLGVLAEQVPSTGEHGPGIASTWLGPAEAGKEVRVLITQWPEVGSLFVWEDTSFEYNGPGGTAYAQLYVEGQPVGTPQPIAMVVGESSAEAYSGGSTSTLNLTVSGSGVQATEGSGGSTVSLSLNTTGSGVAKELASGGSTSILNLSASGGGASVGTTSGGSISTLNLTTYGQGSSSTIILSNLEILSTTSSTVSLRFLVTRG